jgi:hypothetical protein
MPKLKIAGLITVGLVIAALGIAPIGAQTPKPHPDFSGTWVFDDVATGAVATVERKGGPIFGESFVATQTAKTLTFDITILKGAAPVKATYALDGTETQNVSPPQTVGGAPIIVKAATKWSGDKLLIESHSEQPGGPGPNSPKVVQVISIRTIWLDEKGRLVIDRDGTPAPVVPSTRSVYSRKSKP